MNEILADGLNQQDRGKLNNLLLDANKSFGEDNSFIKFLKNLKIKLSPVNDLLSIAEVDNITSSEFGLEVKPLIDIERLKEVTPKLISDVFENEMYVDGIVSKDSTGTLLLIELSFFYDDYLAEAEELFNRVNEIIEPYQAPEKIIVAGAPMVNVNTSQYLNKDLTKLTPLVILIVVISLFFIFRNATGVILPLAVVLVALIWTLGAMALLNSPITLILSAMPVIIIAIGIADGIHLITEYFQLYKVYKDKTNAVIETIKQLAMPVVFTSLTTMAGFLSLATSTLKSIRDFGIYTSVGVFAAMIFSLVFIPAILLLIKAPNIKAQSISGSNDGINRLSNLSVKRRKVTYIMSGLIILIAFVSIYSIKVGTNMVGNFKESSEIYKASEIVNNNFGGTEILNIIVNTQKEDGLKDPEILENISKLQNELEKHEKVIYTASISDYIKRINYVINNNNKDFKRIPYTKETVNSKQLEEVDGEFVEVEKEEVVSGRQIISQYLLLYENAGGDDLESFVDYDYSKANITVQIRSEESKELIDVKNIARNFIKTNMAHSNVQVEYAGNANLLIASDELIIPSQLKSLGVALVVILIMLSLIFRSFKLGALGLSPIILTIGMVFIIMNIFGLNLDYSTALISSIVLGIGVDYSLHFISRYKSLRNQNQSFNMAIKETFQSSGKAIIFNAIAVAIGFLALLFSNFWPIIHIGWLVAANMLLSAGLTLMLIPAVLRIRKKQINKQN